ncbi:MAG: M20/M25/M40 family metallo-hydrolase [Gemmatimonadetes bacterium]|nr:M20/M25/M40 family metallo-hydrolase [Gemmatimonadota bacterium]
MDAALDPTMAALLERADVACARTMIYEDDGLTLRQQRELTEIAAPPFGEGPRSERMAELMAAAGLERTERDALGNVVAWWGRASRAPLVVSAHLDTIFPQGTDVRVRQDGDRWIGPGISDDGRGLAALLALARALANGGIRPHRPILFAATVGEEGEGDLRGVRYLFRRGGPAAEAAAFISLDGAGLSRIVTGGLGSRRFRLTVRGPGGHSWVDWGTPNPIHALGRAVAAFTELALAQEPRTTLSVGRWSGGTSVNAIPQDAWVELEVRSQSLAEIDSLDARIRQSADDALANVNQSANGRGRVQLAVEVIGDRPAGETETGAPLVRAAMAATQAVGAAPELAVSSTDANIPMSLGIPAVTMGAGGEAGLAHTTDEWFRNKGGPEGILRALLTVLRAADRE